MSNTLDVTRSSPNRRLGHRVHPKLINAVICHREYDDTIGIQFLVRWRTKNGLAVPPGSFASWHTADELSECLHLVQIYVESLARSGTSNATAIERSSVAVDQSGLRKRKAPGVGPSRDTASGLLTPQDSDLGRASSVQSTESALSTPYATLDELDYADVYNCLLQKKEGWFRALKSNNSRVIKTNAALLPTSSMRDHAASVTIPRWIHARFRVAFMEKAKAVHNVDIQNNQDDSTPSLDFTFIPECILREGVERAAPETNLGCQYPCRPNMGGFAGCEYTKLCTCLEYAAVDELSLETKDPVGYEEYKKAQKTGVELPEEVTSEFPKKFPYLKPKDTRVPRTLQKFYRQSRHPIYECNPNCNCGPICKTRLVQNGRKVPLTIFKTQDRGWGVYCNEDLSPGEFIDVYLGEIITNKEADRREAQVGNDKSSYLYSLDKFIGDDDGTLAEDTCHVVDGQYMGGPTRFINHSCEPNVRQFTVSYNKYDLWVYDLAFFALEAIPKGTELTFDYMGADEEEEEAVIKKREEALADPANTDKTPCNCGARKCRGFLWD